MSNNNNYYSIRPWPEIEHVHATVLRSAYLAVGTGAFPSPRSLEFELRLPGGTIHEWWTASIS